MAITLGSTSIDQTKGGLSIGFQRVWSQNKGTSITGKKVGTLLGDRIVITIATNQLTDTQVKAIEDVVNTGSGEFNVTFVNPRSKQSETKLFYIEDSTTFSYLCQKRNLYGSSTITMLSVELV